MDFRALIKVQGALMVLLGTALSVPALFSSFAHGEHTLMFVYIALCVSAVGGVLWVVFRHYEAELNLRTSLLVVSISWIVASLIGGLPYYFSGVLPTYADAIFESASGFTGTGASVFTAVEGVDRPILLWRSLTQWLCGLGIIVFFISVLPALGLSNVSLFTAESSGIQKDKIAPRVSDTAKRLWFLYVTITAIAGVVYWLLGMNGFDAVNHALTTIATGGFSTKNNGIAFWNSAALEYAVVIFMLIGSVSFALHFRVLIQRNLSALRASELKWYLGVIALATIVIAGVNYAFGGSELEPALRSALFTTVCTISTTGFTNYNYAEWLPSAQFVIILLMIMGGMSGSTSGGLKAIRTLVAGKQIARVFTQTLHPHAVTTTKIDQHSLSATAENNLWGIIFLYFASFSVVTLILSLYDMPLDVASATALTVLSNVGPALGEFGPYGSFVALDGSLKVFLSLMMIVGRLEFVALLVILTPSFWKK